MRKMRNKSKSSTLEACGIALLGTKICLETKKRGQQGVIREPGEMHVSDLREGDRESRSCIDQ